MLNFKLSPMLTRELVASSLEPLVTNSVPVIRDTMWVLTARRRAIWLPGIYCVARYCERSERGCMMSRAHYSDVIMSTMPMASQITGVSIVWSTVGSSGDQRKHQTSASLAFVRGIHWRLVSSPHKVLVTQKMFQFDDVIMEIKDPLIDSWEMWLLFQKCNLSIHVTD